MADSNATYVDMSKLSQVLTELLGTDLDVTVVCCDGTELTVNQALLEIGSDVFHAMFRSNLVENKSRKVSIDDVSGKTMDCILGYLKTGTLPDLDDMVHEEMLYTLEKYNMKIVKKAVADKLLQAEINQIGDAYELLIQYGDAKDCEKLAKRCALCLKTVPQDQLEKCDANGFLWIAEALKGLLDQAKTANNERKDFWQYFLRMYEPWLRKDLTNRSQTMEKVLGLIDFHLFDALSIMETLLMSPFLDVVSPFLTAIIRRMSGLEAHMKARENYAKHIAQCPNASIQCTQCRFIATPEKFHSNFNCVYASRCTVCNVQLTLPQTYNQASVQLLAGTEPIFKSNVL